MPPRTWFLVLALTIAAPALRAGQQPAPPGEIPLERCDKLPVAKVRIDGADFRFLVDTGATTFLHLKSFAGGRSSNIQISSWAGTGSTHARAVSLPSLVVGSHELKDLKLPAIDLAAIGDACGGKIDGILGVDLLEELGATIDLQKHVVRFAASTIPPPETDAALLKRYFEYDDLCIDAFNRADAKFLASCLDSAVVLFTPNGEYRGREAMLKYVTSYYFAMKPLPRLERTIKSARFIGNAAWYDYDYSLTTPAGRMEGRGTGVCRRDGDRWLMVNMHNSRIEPEPAPRPN